MAIQGGFSCPLCGEYVEAKRIVNTYIWICEACPFVGFEYYTKEDTKAMSDYLNRDY